MVQCINVHNLFLCQKHLQYAVIIISAYIIVVIIRLPIIESNFTSMYVQKGGGTDIIFVKVLLMLITDMLTNLLTVLCSSHLQYWNIHTIGRGGPRESCSKNYFA